ncbi:hypothetical protein K450DRAFT_249503 [Umbelopsis ramanniana AG]|uniref:Uncharacterized protein n=1 Tax=Umbelopsis ramanniana AG TaxID=1314678 RepID=A0AAD5E807_UMBRA|nr:uncharacterized protein K450DRAFT_249503 [Umbelopsis ramanniana AG]KAI8578015.1 hypothetical protein K450DRAFT_249503 [Umbelopsis ramanniana AG]
MFIPMDKGTASYILADANYKHVNIDLSKDIDRRISEREIKKKVLDDWEVRHRRTRVFERRHNSTYTHISHITFSHRRTIRCCCCLFTCLDSSIFLFYLFIFSFSLSTLRSSLSFFPLYN